MADYTKYRHKKTVEQDTTSSVDYTKYRHSARPQVAPITLPELPTPEDSMRRDMRKVLVEGQGFSPAKVNTLMAPEGNPGLVDPTLVRPAAEDAIDQIERARVRETTIKVLHQLDAEGLPLEPDDAKSLEDIMGIYGAEAIEDFAEARDWWTDLKRQTANATADMVTGGAANLTLGMALLDGVLRMDNVVLSKFLPKKSRAELENEILPTITLNEADPKEFSTGTAAALWTIAHKMWGYGESVAGKEIALAASAGKNAVKLLNSDSLNDLLEGAQGFGEQLAEKGYEKQQFVEGQIPPLAAGLAKPLSWQEIIERNLGDPEEADYYYKYLDDQGMYGKMKMMGIAGTIAFADVFLTPSFLLGPAIGKIPKVAQGMLGQAARKFPSVAGKVAEVTAEAAYRSNRLEDAVDAVRAAELHYSHVQAQADKAVQESVASTGEARMPGLLHRKLIQARRNLNNQKMALDSFSSPNWEEVYLATPRRAPKLLPPPPADPIGQEMHKARAAALERGPDNLIDWEATIDRDRPAGQLRQILGPDDAQVSGDGLNMAVRTGGLSIDDMAELPAAPEYYVTPAHGPIPMLPWRDLDVAGDIVNAERRYVKSLQGLPEPRPHYERQKEIEERIAAKGAQLQRLKDALAKVEAKSTPEISVKFTGGEELKSLAKFRKTEFFGRAGVEAPKTAVVEPVPAKKPPKRLVKKMNRAINQTQEEIKRLYADLNKIEPFAPSAELERSTTRMLLRQEDIIRRNLGTARATKNKPMIRQYEKYLKDIQRSQRLAKNIKKADAVYEDVWLPADQPGIMDTPERFNRWLRIAGDRVVRTIVPGGLRLGYWHSRTGQAHGVIREPQRFFEQFDPEAWNRIRSDKLRYDQSLDAWNDLGLRIGEKGGAVSFRKNYDPLVHWAPHDYDKEMAKELFNLLDTVVGTEEHAALRAEASPAMLEMHDRMRKAFDTIADAGGLREADRYLTGYIRHFFTRDQFRGGYRPLEYLGLPRHAEVFASYLLNRRGNEGFVRDAFLAWELYGRAAHRKLILEPMYDYALRRGEIIARTHENPALMTYVNDFVSTLKGAPTLTGAKVDEAIGGVLNKNGKILWQPNSVDRMLMGVSNLIYTGNLTGNPRYPYMQIATAIPTTSMRFGLFRTARSLFEMATREGQALNKTAGTYRSFSEIFESPNWRRLSKLATETIPTISPFGVMTNAAAERAIRGMTLHAAIDMYLTKFGLASWQEAAAAGLDRTILFQALRASEEVNHMFGAMGRSPWVTRTFGGTQGVSVTATQFLSFMWKQTDELLSNVSRGGLESLGRIGEYMAVSGFISEIAAKDLGIDATTYVGLGYLPQEPDEMTSPGVDMALQLINTLAAMSMRNPDEIRDSTENLLRSTQSLIPLMAALETTGKGAQRLVKKELKTNAGEKLRDLDFKGTMPEKIGETTIGDIMRSIRPEGGPTPSLGGELLPTVLGQQNIKERLLRRARRAVIQEDRRFAFNQRRAIENYVKAVEDDDVAGEEKFAKELENMWRIRLSSSTPIERAIEARSISWALRLVEEDSKLRDRYVKILRDFGVGME